MVLGAILGAIPKVEGFSPLPLGIMAPFMAYQSGVMAFAFGLNYEIGKRKIKSMSNEQFNTLTAEDVRELQAEQHSVQIDTFIQELPHTRTIQDKILTEMVHLEGEKFKLIPKIIQEIGDSTWELIFGEVKRVEELGGSTGGDSGSGGGGAPGDDNPHNCPAGQHRDRNGKCVDDEVTPPPPPPPPDDPLDKLMKLIRIGDTAMWPDYNGKVQSLHKWISEIKTINAYVNTKLFAGQSKSFIANWLGTLYLMRQQVHEATGTWY